MNHNIFIQLGIFINALRPDRFNLKCPSLRIDPALVIGSVKNKIGLFDLPSGRPLTRIQQLLKTILGGNLPRNRIIFEIFGSLHSFKRCISNRLRGNSGTRHIQILCIMPMRYLDRSRIHQGYIHPESQSNNRQRY